MTFNELLENFGRNTLNVVMQTSQDGVETGYATEWDADQRIRYVLSPDAYKSAGNPNVNNFVVLTSNLVSKDKEVEDKDTGEINTIEGSAYTNHFVILGQPTITLGKH
tara:strand:- start:73 stop:396 length:324 start_codon:yes stop_codon:yes gene_type:complete